jgi:hypothetical protein
MRRHFQSNLHHGAQSMKLITARYAGRSQSGAPINPGDRIAYDPRNKHAWLAHELEPDLDPETAEAVGRYMASRLTVSDHFRIGGRDYFRNKRGRCEDAPCCGCCTI